jgi:hypothetical protein
MKARYDRFVPDLRLPDLTSFSHALNVTTMIGLALTYAASSKGLNASPKASRALQNLRAKILRLGAEIELIEQVKKGAASDLEQTWSTSAAEAAPDIERIGEHLRAFLEGIRGAHEATNATDQAITEALKYDAIYQVSIPKWRDHTAAVRGALAQIHELLEGEIPKWLAGLQPQVAGLLQRAVADQGLTDWSDSMNPDDSELVDAEGGSRVRWDPAAGWQSP